MTMTRPASKRGSRRRRLDPRREILIDLVTDGPAKGWLHTHGLEAYGEPELEIRGVPLFLGPLASRVLNDLADYMLNDAEGPVLAGQLIRFGRSSIQVVDGGPDDDAGYDAGHYRTPRLLLVDPPDTGCECDECARSRPRLVS